MPTRDSIAENGAEKQFGKNMDISAHIFDWARFGKTVKEVHMGKNALIGDFCFISVPILMLGDGSQINSGTRIIGHEPVFIRQNSVVSYGCSLITSSDSTEAKQMNDASPRTERIIRSAPIEIGDSVFLGAHSIIMPGVVIPSRIVVRAFSYVNKSLHGNDAIFGGQPAQFIKQRVYTPRT
jgi:galactoside O-acetyltransferase